MLSPKPRLTHDQLQVFVGGQVSISDAERSRYRTCGEIAAIRISVEHLTISFKWNAQAKDPRSASTLWSRLGKPDDIKLALADCIVTDSAGTLIIYLKSKGERIVFYKPGATFLDPAALNRA
jgi:hypothetical protein